ncbi:hypothetical protein SAMN04488036_104351 [Shimia haliotis]|uniref:Uncharacterized protein n=1 Tax=Shimia haliotis TaxID=1280847 RepID=A0A1I4ELT8_9RHOB|nr:hypothetical protein SAMN04488036_104351 [Shimia haliotis]
MVNISENPCEIDVGKTSVLCRYRVGAKRRAPDFPDIETFLREQADVFGL